MEDVVIQVNNLSKHYHIGRLKSSQRTLREALASSLKAPLYRMVKLLTGKTAGSSGVDEVIWALEGISFAVKRGEVVGIIGPNGAGKSTLLKIISRITKPTDGYATIHGRVGSLLEVGTGFHHELTGRENIYLNGAILGMKKREIDRKFDEIVAFAEVGQFIDTPVKHYSSGMFVRLAFAVAAHLEPDILIVDEVLSVGDAQFQKKCLGRMGAIAHGGRTVLFVSHNMGAINSLCERALWIEKGKIARDGTASQVVSSYLNQGTLAASERTWSNDNRPGNQSFKLASIALKNAAGIPASEINISENALFEIEYEITRPGTRAIFSLTLFDVNGNCVFSSLSNTEENDYDRKPLQAGYYRNVCILYGNFLNDGHYYVSITGLADHWSDPFSIEYAISFEALDDGILRKDYPGRYGGAVRPKLIWETFPVPDK